MIKVHSPGKGEIRVTLEEAERILREIYEDPIGGYVVNARTDEVVRQIGPDIEEIIVIEQVLRGG
jgi:hypothetical protein